MYQLNGIVGFVLTLPVIFSLVAAQQAPKPHLVVIVADDMVTKEKLTRNKNN